MQQHINTILQSLGWENLNIKIDNRRCTLPTAYTYPNMDELILITANKPSLIRYALAHLIAHEKAEIEYYKQHPGFDGDTHQEPLFLELESMYLDEINELIYKEHEE